MKNNLTNNTFTFTSNLDPVESSKLAEISANLADIFEPNPNELQFLFDVGGVKTLGIGGDKKNVSRFEFYGKILESIATVLNQEEKTNHTVYFISFDDKGLKYSVKGDNIIQYQEAYTFLIKEAIQNV